MLINSKEGKKIITAILKSSVSNLLRDIKPISGRMCYENKYVIVIRSDFLHQETNTIIDCALVNSPAINIQSERINDCANMENRRELSARVLLPR